MRSPARRAIRAALVLALGGTAAACAQILGADFGDYAATCTATDACDDQNPCTADACGAEGRCTHDPTSDGDAPATLQRAGDCIKAYCLGGLITAVDDDADVSDDGSTCTADACDKGRSVHTALPDDSPCAPGAATGRCSAGACVVECGEKLPPCDDGDRCTKDSCDAGAGRCVFAALPDQPIPGVKDAEGDCRRALCVGGKEVASAPADDDLPIVESPGCAQTSCSKGAPDVAPRPEGTACADGGGAVCDGAGRCVACLVEGDCVGLPPSNECRTRTCLAHTCGTDLVAANTAIVSQTIGDCRVVVCDGAGNTASAGDDSDLPNDGNDCRDHLCANGAPQTPPRAIGTKCGLGGAFVCDGLGACVGCLTGSDCPGVDDDCKTRTCVASTCGLEYTWNGTPLPDPKQIQGDCKRRTCDGQGGTKDVVLNSDLPVDGNECTKDACTVGSPSNTPVAMDTLCAGGYCDGQSSCVGCNKASQCPAAPLCSAAVCNNHACATALVAKDTVAPLASQTPGDCKDVVCDGLGAATTKPNVNDLPSDSNACTSDTCSAQGTPTFTPRAPKYPCAQNGGKVCNGAGACVGCVDNADCTLPSTCGGGNPGTPNACGCTKKTCAQLGLTCGSAADGCGVGGTVACNDGVTNGNETDVDCGGGGGCSAKCGVGKACAGDSDCASAKCLGGICN